jgi:hypothetical protein
MLMTTATMKPMNAGMMSGMGMGAAMPTMNPAMSGMMIPRCTMKLEKCTGGMKIHCSCDDKMACSMLQNLCTMLANSKCSCCCMMNGAMVCCCNLAGNLLALPWGTFRIEWHCLVATHFCHIGCAILHPFP